MALLLFGHLVTMLYPTRPCKSCTNLYSKPCTVHCWTLTFRHSCGSHDYHVILIISLRAFCYFNNVALAAKAMVSKSKRVMVVDWVRGFVHL